MKAILTLLVCALCVSARAKDVLPEMIPVERIAKILPQAWFIESVERAFTVSGWDNLQTAKGVRLTILRHPYDLSLHKDKPRGLSVSVPRVTVYIFPLDFQGKHVNTFAVFRDGKITPSSVDPSHFANHAIEIMDKFVTLKDWYLFHDGPSFRDWSDPIANITRAIEEVPNKASDATSEPAPGAASSAHHR